MASATDSRGLSLLVALPWPGMVVHTTNKPRKKPTGSGAFVFAVGGLLAGLATASCCALPILLGTLGVGSASLFRLAVVAAPHRTVLLIIGGLAIVIAAGMLLRQRTQVCEPGALCAKPAARVLTTAALFVGVALLVAGYVYV